MWEGCETLHLEVAGSNWSGSKSFTNLRLISKFLFHIIELLFVIFSLVFAKLSFDFVKNFEFSL